MDNLFSYLDWRGDLSFSAAPPNELDMAVFAALSYARFEELSPWDTYNRTLGELGQEYGERIHQPETSELRRCVNRLWDRVTITPRFMPVALVGFSSRFIESDIDDGGEQFAAVTFAPPEGAPGAADAVVAFRGTDSTVVGWQEDFAMGYQESVLAQHDAAAYLAKECERFASLAVCGHSKGGNLALFAAACTNRPDRVSAVWNFDGPGLRDAMLETPGWEAVKDRTRTLVPEGSVFGMFFGRNQVREPKAADGIGVGQHSIFQWHACGTTFVPVEKLTSTSEAFGRSLVMYMDTTTPEERRTFTDAMFRLIQMSGISNTDDLIPALIRRIPAIIAKGDLFSEEEKAALKTFW